MSTDITSAAQQKIDYMSLLITELRNQNPLEPMDNQQMAAQLAQISQLELTEEMNTNLETINSAMSDLKYSFEGSLWMAQVDYAKSLLGKTVSFYNTENGDVLEGQVKKLTFQNSQPVLTIHTSGQDAKDYTISVNQIEGIQA
jgi:flagellar basal-body rod modification protein FlgD